MSEKSLHMRSDILKFKKERFFKILCGESCTNNVIFAERFGVSQSTILCWRKEYDNSKRKGQFRSTH